MIALGWNYRGLRNPRSVRVLRELVQRWKPNIVILSETKMKKYQMEKVKFKIGLMNGLIVPSVGRSGGLAMLWSRDIKLEVQSYSRNFVDAVVTDFVRVLNGVLPDFIVTPKLVVEKNHGIFCEALTECAICPNCALVILMK